MKNVKIAALKHTYELLDIFNCLCVLRVRIVISWQEDPMDYFGLYRQPFRMRQFLYTRISLENYANRKLFSKSVE